MTLDILDVVQLRGERIVDIDDNDLPVRLILVQEGHHTQHLDLLDLSRVADKLADLADVKWVIVSLGFGLGMCDVWVFPGLDKSVTSR